MDMRDGFAWDRKQADALLFHQLPGGQVRSSGTCVPCVLLTLR